MRSSPPVRKAVFPVAGLGTRFLPATKAIPKEMLPVVDKPLIQYAVEEAIEAGVDTLIMVTRGDKQAISDHFNRSGHLEEFLEQRGKAELLQDMRDILPPGIKLREAIQAEPLGLGHAVLCAQEWVGDEAFAVLLPDDMVKTRGQGCLAAMVDAFGATGVSQVGVEEIAPVDCRRYGVAAVERTKEGAERITEIVEKPEPKAAPSNLGVVGRYVFTGEIFQHLSKIGAGAGGEIQLTDAIARLMMAQPVHAFRLNGKRYDCGSRFGLLAAQLDYAMDIEELAEPLRAAMSELMKRHGGA
ncbi:MAG: UTP--glucose-1-phosphate uridylyltransferase GalU [Gammaproteobacteria bacterium]|nr:UTP--glucose-1-phosphate uridylyltransferase GalU [Gammaproteobacteria bacterium]